MKIELHEIPIREIVNGYTDNQEEREQNTTAGRGN
jgi:hypothetical protein